MKNVQRGHRCEDLLAIGVKAQARRDACVRHLADSLARLRAADEVRRSIVSSIDRLSADPAPGVRIDPAIESFRQRFRSSRCGELREVSALVQRLRGDADESRRALRQADGLCGAIEALARARALDEAKRDGRRAQTQVDDQWLQRLGALRSGGLG